MKKFFVALLVAVGLHAAPVQAQINDQFDVNITLVPTCTLATAPGDISLSYTSGAAGTVSNTTTFDVRCTSGWPYTFTLSNVATPAITDSTAPIAITVTDATLALDYVVEITGGVGGGTGNGANQTYTIQASITGVQNGACPGGVCTNGASGNKTQQLTISY